LSVHRKTEAETICSAEVITHAAACACAVCRVHAGTSRCAYLSQPIASTARHHRAPRPVPAVAAAAAAVSTADAAQRRRKRKNSATLHADGHEKTVFKQSTTIAT